MVDVVYLSDSEEFENAFIEEMLLDIEHIKEIFDPIYPRSIEQWISTFLCAVNPHKELNWWLSFAELFSEYTTDMSLETCKQIFNRMYMRSVDETWLRIENCL